MIPSSDFNMFILIKWLSHNSVTVLEETRDFKEKRIGENIKVKYGKKFFVGKIICRNGKNNYFVINVRVSYSLTSNHLFNLPLL